MSKVADPSLAAQGRLKIEWAESRMPVLMKLRQKYEQEKPLRGQRIAGCLHVTKDTAVLVETLVAAGAQVAWCGCNPLSTQDDVAAALAGRGVEIYAWRGLSTEEYYWCIEQVLKIKPTLTLDDGADLIFVLHSKFPELIGGLVGGTEETTTGVMRLRAMAADGKLLYPVIAINDAATKWEMDNVHGTGQSTLDGIMRATNILFAGKTVVVAGYGHCGRGVANRVRGLGANVIATEVDPVSALKARMEGFSVMSMDDAAPRGDIFITTTGVKDIIIKRHFEKMKDGAVVCNSGHYNVEISIPDLEILSRGKRTVRKDNVEYRLGDGRRIYLLADGRLVNLAAAEGHPSEVMDLSFANQVLALVRLATSPRQAPGVINLPKSQDAEIARIKLETMGIRIDDLSAEQKKYIESYAEGT